MPTDSNKTQDIIRITNSEEFKAKLDIPMDYNIPEFREVLEFTKNELEELKLNIKNKDKNEVFGIINSTIIKKIENKKKIEWKSVESLTWAKMDILKTQVTPNSWSDKKPNNTPKVNNNNVEWNTASNIHNKKEIVSSNAMDIVKNGLLIWWVAVVGYKAISWMFGDSKDGEENQKQEWFVDSVLDKIWLKWDFAKWTKWFGIFWLIGAIGASLFMWTDKLGEYAEKIGGWFWWESKEKKETVAKAVEVLAKEKYPVSENVIRKLEKKWITINDIKWPFYTKIKSVLAWIWGFVWSNIPDFIKGQLWMDFTQEEVKELENLGKYITDNKIQAWKNATITELCKAIKNDWKYEDSKDPEKNVQIWKETIAMNESGEKWKLEQNWQAPNKNTDKQPDILSQGIWADPMGVLSARMYQFKYGFFDSYVKMSDLEKKHFSDTVGLVFNKYKPTYSHADAKANLPNLTTEFESLSEKITNKTATIEEELKHIMLHDEIKAIKDWSEAFDTFKLANPEEFITRVKQLEVDQAENLKNLKRQNGRYNMTEHEEFQKIVKEYNTLLDHQDNAASKLDEEIKIIDEKIRASTNPGEIQKLESLKLEKNTKLAEVTESAKKLHVNFLESNKSRLAQAMSSEWVRKRWDIFGLKMKTSTDISELSIAPKRKFFRFWTFKWAIVFTCIWAWLSAYNSKKETWKIDMDKVKATWWRVWAGFVPLYWTYLDARDAVESVKSWDILWTVANTGAFTASLAGDILLWISVAWTMWLGTPVWVGAKWIFAGLRWAIKWLKMSKEATAMAKVGNIAKVGAIGWTVVTLWAWIVVPLVSYWINKYWNLEEQDISKIDQQEFEKEFEELEYSWEWAIESPKSV